MNMNQTPMSERVHIGFFGKRNAGKSSVMNAVTGQDLAVVSEVKGTTTDPVYKSMELLPLGPVVMMDTPGIDDEGGLGGLRVKKSYQVLNKTDAAVLVIDGAAGASAEDAALLDRIRKKNIPYTVALNKQDLAAEDMLKQAAGILDISAEQILAVSAADGTGITELKERIAAIAKQEEPKLRIVGDMISPSDFIILVVPIDSAAPKGRLILPQVNAIRSLLDIGALVTVVQPQSLDVLFHNGNREGYSLVVTDSQAFSEVASVVPEEVPLTSFSMLLARSKGCFEQYCKGTPMIDRLQDGDRVLILESCSHHSSCEDIGRVKIPALMRRRTGKSLTFDVVGGLDRIARPITDYSLVLQCGGCMITRRQLYSRLLPAMEEGIPVTNYGMAISYMKGIYERALKPLLVR